MSEWTPKPKADAKTEDMNLTGEEGFVLSRIDGATTLQNLVHLTGLPEARVRQIVNKLVRQGAVEGSDGSATPSSAPATVVGLGVETTSKTGVTIVDELSPSELDSLLGDASEELPGAVTDPSASPARSGPEPVELPSSPTLDDLDDLDDPSVVDDDEHPATDEDEAVPAPSAEELASQEQEEREEASHLKLYKAELASLEAVQREALAASAKDPQLSALCFDPLPSVMKQLVDNPAFAPQHARLLARHHRTGQGLDFVMAKGELLRDPQVQRFLLANPMLQEAQLKRLLQPRRLAEIYKATINREIPERNRQKSRTVLRSKWATSEGEERAGLVLTTEGRCLTQLSGLPFDSQTTALLCGKTYTSLLLITNLVRFGPTPAMLLTHLSKQALVRRQPHLRTLITQHPNCPAEVKRAARS